MVVGEDKFCDLPRRYRWAVMSEPIVRLGASRLARSRRIALASLRQ